MPEVVPPQRKNTVQYAPIVKRLLAGYGGARLDDPESLRDGIMRMMRDADYAAGGDENDADISEHNAHLIKLAEVDGNTDAVIKDILVGLSSNITLLCGSDTPEDETMFYLEARSDLHDADPQDTELEDAVDATLQKMSRTEVRRDILAALKKTWHTTMVEDLTDYVGTHTQRIGNLLRPPGGSPDVEGLCVVVKEIEDRVTEDCVDKMVATVVMHVAKTHPYFLATAMLKRIVTLAEQGSPVRYGDVVYLQEADINVVGRMFCANSECFLLGRDLIEGDVCAADACDILARSFKSVSVDQ